MAKAKDDAPTYLVEVQNGRLVPATPFDQERLDSYRNGTKLRVRLEPNQDRPAIRNWWRILHLAIKQTRAGELWPNAQVASSAIKLSLNLVDTGKTDKGTWFREPVSLTTLDDPDLDSALEGMKAVLYRVTGVDVSTLEKEAPDAGEHEQNSSVPSELREPDGHSTDEEGSDGNRAAPPYVPEPVAADNPTPSQDLGADDDGAAGEPPASAPASAGGSFPIDEAAWMMTYARAMVGSIGPDETVIVNQAKGLIPVEGLSVRTVERAKSILSYCRAIGREDMDKAKGLQMIAGIAGCDVKDLKP